MSFFRNLRRTDKIYPNNNAFVTDFYTYVNPTIPSGFNFGNPTTTNIGSNRFVPSYDINGNVVTNSNMNTIFRNNDVSGLRNVFPNTNNNQINGLGGLRRADNIPDATVNSLEMRKNSVRNSHPETATRSREGVEQALNRNPRLYDYFKSAVGLTMAGAFIYFTINAADLIGSIVNAMNRTGGSWLLSGNNGADNMNNIEKCVLRYRSCGVALADYIEEACYDPHDNSYLDPLLTISEAQIICQGYNQNAEGTVCRASNSNANPDSPQYYDPSDLAVSQAIFCVEPYDLADLIADLGLDGLLGENGLLTNSSNSFNKSSGSLSENLMTLLYVIGAVVLLVFIGYVIIKMLNRPQQQQPPPPPPPRT
ncbi:odv-e56 [Spodoptera litura granulovirus]|uniref:Odv-e56 n=1 Tax=Spodoptera litura granulovirus TaxID=359919 RepID=A5IZL5_9BBAC|nr:odv-e56 [Spodoptera litura granulovirus]ABQ51956.1 odv-e56 [Spodoptera litura granulovirus]